MFDTLARKRIRGFDGRIRKPLFAMPRRQRGQALTQGVER